MNRNWLLVLAVFFPPCAFGGGAEGSAADLRKVPVGFHASTSKGGAFTLVFRSPAGKEMWRDEKTKIVWGDKLSQRIRRKAAGDLCKKSVEGETVGGGQVLNELPTTQDFATAEEHGFREVLPNMVNSYYWVKASVPGAANIGYVFSTNLGRPIIILYRSINYENLRCIQRNAG